MKRFAIIKQLTILLAIFIIALCLLMPIIETSRSHTLMCDSSNCLICLVADTVNNISICILLIIFAIIPITSEQIFKAWQHHPVVCEQKTPISLKTQINS